MPRFVYLGPSDSFLLRGVVFPCGVPVDVDNEALAQKCRTLGFEEKSDDGSDEQIALPAEAEDNPPPVPEPSPAEPRRGRGRPRKVR